MTNDYLDEDRFFKLGYLCGVKDALKMCDEEMPGAGRAIPVKKVFDALDKALTDHLKEKAKERQAVKKG